MSSFPGSIDGSTGDLIKANFDVDGTTYKFEGTPKPEVQPFSCAHATLNGNLKDLDGTHPFTCITATDHVVIFIDNGPKMAGALDAPVASGSDVSGDGTWSH